MLKLVIFDWDGTLADSVEKIIQCKRFLATKYGLTPPSDEVVKSVLGTKFESALATCFPLASKEMLHQIGNDFHILMRQPDYQALLFPGTKEMLEGLKKSGLRFAIATSKARKEMGNALLYNNLLDIFELVCCGDEFPGKPDPSMLNHIMKKCHVKPEECVVVGDTVFDMLFAANAGIKAIGVTFGAHSLQKLRTANPDALISEWSQLPETIEKVCSLNRIYCRL